MSNKKIRITNTTALASKGKPGFGLEFQGHYVAANRQLVLDLPVIPVTLEEWQAKGWVRIEDADAAPVSKPGEEAVTLGTVVQEAVASEVLSSRTDEDDILEDEEFDLTIAKEATMPVTQSSEAILGATAQMPDGRASVSLGSSQETVSAELVSPIPGDKPRSVDESEKFTVRAPRAAGVGAVIKA